MSTNYSRSSGMFLGLLIAAMLVVAACGDAEGDDESADAGARELDRPIHFAEQAHDSFLALNAIARFVAEEGYGYETEATHAETVALWQGLTTGDMDVSMEIWVDQMPYWEEGLEEGLVHDLGPAFDETIQGWFVPTYVIEGDEERGIEPMTPDLSHIDDLPGYWEVFQDPEDSNKGRFYDCIAGWECEQVNRAKIEAYGLDEYYNRFLPGSGPALDTSLVTAYERGEPWLGTYWGPTWMFALLDLAMLDEPEYTEECWDEVMEAAAEGTVPDQACAYPIVPVHVAVHEDFPDLAPDYVEFLENLSMTMDDVSEILFYMHENDVDADEGAMWFFDEREDLWTEWVPDDVEERVLEALERR
jgi:glycine betaine/proline transport system substrate-binding protein